MPANSQQPDWLSPEAEQQGIQRYVQTIRERWMLIVACVVLCGRAAALYVASADKVSRASADMLVTPVPGDDTTQGLPLIIGSSDPTRDVSTAARYVTSRIVAQRVKTGLQLSESPNQLLNAIAAKPLAGSSAVTATAESDDPEKAAKLANEFAAETARWRTAERGAQLEDGKIVG